MKHSILFLCLLCSLLISCIYDDSKDNNRKYNDLVRSQQKLESLSIGTTVTIEDSGSTRITTISPWDDLTDVYIDSLPIPRRSNRTPLPPDSDIFSKDISLADTATHHLLSYVRNDTIFYENTFTLPTRPKSKISISDTISKFNQEEVIRTKVHYYFDIGNYQISELTIGCTLYDYGDLTFFNPSDREFYHYLDSDSSTDTISNFLDETFLLEIDSTKKNIDAFGTIRYNIPENNHWVGSYLVIQYNFKPQSIVIQDAKTFLTFD